MVLGMKTKTVAGILFLTTVSCCIAGIALTIGGITSDRFVMYETLVSSNESDPDYEPYNPYRQAKIDFTVGDNESFSSLVLFLVSIAKMAALFWVLAMIARVYGTSEGVKTHSDLVHSLAKVLELTVLECGIMLFINNNVDYPGQTGYGVNFGVHRRAGFWMWLIGTVCTAVPPILYFGIVVASEDFRGHMKGLLKATKEALGETDPVTDDVSIPGGKKSSSKSHFSRPAVQRHHMHGLF